MLLNGIWPEVEPEVKPEVISQPVMSMYLLIEDDVALQSMFQSEPEIDL